MPRSKSYHAIPEELRVFFLRADYYNVLMRLHVIDAYPKAFWGPG